MTTENSKTRKSTSRGRRSNECPRLIEGSKRESTRDDNAGVDQPGKRRRGAGGAATRRCDAAPQSGGKAQHDQHAFALAAVHASRGVCLWAPDCVNLRCPQYPNARLHVASVAPHTV